MVDLALLGCGGGMPMPNRYLSSLLINYLGRKVLLDCGEGTQVSMKLLGWGFKTIDVICITHSHGDHIVGLPGLLSTIGNSGRLNPLTIIGPKGITNIINGLRVIFPYLPYEVNIIENPTTISFKVHKNEGLILNENGDLKINTLELEHSTDCLGYSLYIKRAAKFNVDRAIANNVPKILWSTLQKEEKSTLNGITYYANMVLGAERRGLKISYITDSRPIDPIIPFINESDLFICEGTYGKDEDKDKAVKNKHMTFREASELAKKGNVVELLLTHFSPALDEPSKFLPNAEEVFSNVTIGEDRLVKNLSFTD